MGGMLGLLPQLNKVPRADPGPRDGACPPITPHQHRRQDAPIVRRHDDFVVVPRLEGAAAADRIGVVIAARAGYEPYGLVMVLQTLQSLGPGDAEMAFFLKTHPSPSDRLAALEVAMPPSFEQLAEPNPALARYAPVFKPTRK